MNPSNNWISTTKQPINQQLLIGGKQLMKAVYDYDKNAPDYLPTSYQINDQTLNLTNYKHHIENSNTSIYWKDLANGNYAWSCNTDIVLESSYLDKNPSINGFLCLTDCSGFATGLLAFCNAVGNVPTVFSDWKKGKNVPNASQYLESFNDKNNPNFALIDTINQVEPGDFITFGYHTQGHENTGHIMLIVATRKVNNFQTEVVIMDESSGIHTQDTRLITKDGKPVIVNGKHAKVRGIGMGKALIGRVIKGETGAVVPFTGATGQDITKSFLGFYWGDGINHTLEYPIAIGRAQ